MLLKPTALIYSSHDRCEYLHRRWIVDRALESPDNKTILYLPMSMTRRHQQEYSWSTFRWYFNNFADQGLRAYPFFWTDELSKQDAAVFFEMVRDSEVVILGGGSSFVGTERYNAMGGMFFGDEDLFSRILHQRQERGMLTVGFSAGAIQLADSTMYEDAHRCYSLINNVTSVLHYEWGGEADLLEMGRSLPHCLAFGLPNDSGIASNQGYLGSGNKWQLLQFIVDNSWSSPADQYHIKTRQGLRIDHMYQDGRKWTFNGGDAMLRVFSPDYRYQGAWIQPAGSSTIYDYWSQRPAPYRHLQHILDSH